MWNLYVFQRWYNWLQQKIDVKSHKEMGNVLFRLTPKILNKSKRLSISELNENKSLLIKQQIHSLIK